MKMPVFFIGHGSPMNAIEQNAYTEGWRKSVENVPIPKAVLVVSAHWETRGTLVTAMPKPRTIHDFYGFPQALFDVQYPAQGSPETAHEISENFRTIPIGLDENWGLDHGAWSVLAHLFPKADVPILQMSLDYAQIPMRHLEIGKELKTLREKGVLIIGSGNIVHNLRLMNFRDNDGFDWANEANEKLKSLIVSGAHDSLAEYANLGREINLGIPTPEHFLPLLYALGLKEENEEIEFFNDAVDLGSIAMTSLKIG